MKRRAEATATLAVLVLNSMATITTHASPSYVAPDISSVHIKSQGKTLYGRVFSPALQSAQSKAPAVFMLHGIPGTEQNFDVAYALRDAGFICLLWHYRGCWGSEGSYSIDGLPNDIEAAFRWFRSQPNVDEDNLVIVGHSLGGYHSLRLATESLQGKEVWHTRLRGVVALCPLVATECADVPLDDDLARDFATMLNHVPPQTLQTQWAQLTPVKQMLQIKPREEDSCVETTVNKKRLPLLVITGDEDPLFSPDYYIKHLEAPLQEAGVRKMINSKWVRLPYGDHALCRYRREVVRRVVNFARSCAGVGRRIDLWQLGREALSFRGLFDPVPMMLILSSVSGFVGGRYCATPEGSMVAMQSQQELDQLRHQAMESRKVMFKM